MCLYSLYLPSGFFRLMHDSSGYFVLKKNGVNNRTTLNKMFGYLDVLYIKQVVKLTYPIQLLIKNRKFNFF